MSTPGAADVPASQRRRQQGLESLPDVNQHNRGLYKLVLWFIGVALILGICLWFYATVRGIDFPEGLAVIVGALSGGLLGVIKQSDG